MMFHFFSLETSSLEAGGGPYLLLSLSIIFWMISSSDTGLPSSPMYWLLTFPLVKPCKTCISLSAKLDRLIPLIELAMGPVLEMNVP